MTKTKKEPRQLRIETVLFARKKNTPSEKGIMINEDLLIVDMNGKIVKGPIWNYQKISEIVVTIKEEL